MDETEQKFQAEIERLNKYLQEQIKNGEESVTRAKAHVTNTINQIEVELAAHRARRDARAKQGQG